jgi:hypothetical protein
MLETTVVDKLDTEVAELSASDEGEHGSMRLVSWSSTLWDKTRQDRLGPGSPSWNRGEAASSAFHWCLNHTRPFMARTKPFLRQ